MPDRGAGDAIAILIHEALNQLQVAQTRVQMAEEYTRRAAVATAQGAKLLHEAMTKATRLGTPRGQRVELNLIMQEIVDHLEGVFPGVELRAVPGAAPLFTDVDHDLLFRALDNLVRNAADAMPAGGVVTLSTVFQNNGQMVCIQVRDTGIGMDPATQAQIWQPRFTTKDTSLRPRGLGLSQVKTFVEEHGGRARVESKLGEGSTFELCFPRVLEPTA